MGDGGGGGGGGGSAGPGKKALYAMTSQPASRTRIASKPPAGHVWECGYSINYFWLRSAGAGHTRVVNDKHRTGTWKRIGWLQGHCLFSFLPLPFLFFVASYPPCGCGAQAVMLGPWQLLEGVRQKQQGAEQQRE